MYFTSGIFLLLKIICKQNGHREDNTNNIK